jgi:hypothetical protein
MFGVHGQPTSTERRSRTTTVAILAAAHIGTSGVLACGKHAWGWEGLGHAANRCSGLSTRSGVGVSTLPQASESQTSASLTSIMRFQALT